MPADIRQEEQVPERPLKICHFTSSLLNPLGGAEQYCLRVAEWQHDNGYEVTVAAAWISDSVRGSLENVGVQVLDLRGRRPYPPNQSGSGIRRLAYHLMEMFAAVHLPRRFRIALRNFDVLHVHRFQGVGLSMLKSRSAKVVHTVHDYGLVDPNATSVRGKSRLVAIYLQVWRWLSNLAVSPKTILVFPSVRTLQRHRVLGLTHDAVVVPHGWGELAVEPKSEVRTGPVTILYLGKLSEAKGILALLGAWGEGVEGCRLLIAGAGDLSDVVQRESNAVSHMSFLGWLDDTSRAATLREVDALVLPSLWPENFPLVVADAILNGLPVISSCSASPPLVIDGISGLIATDDSPEALRSVIQRFSNEPGLRRRLREGAVALAPELSPAAHLSRLRSLYIDQGPT